MSEADLGLSGLLADWINVPTHRTEAAAERILTGAETQLAADEGRGVDRATWLTYLEQTRYPDFLTTLPDATARLRWAETTFRIIEAIDFDLGKLFEQRTAAHPGKILFREMSGPGSGSWSYSQVDRLIRAIAAVFLAEAGPRENDTDGPGEPRIALFCDNSIGSACCDLACLTQRIFVSPLNVHFTAENLVWIFDRLQITAAVCDHPDRLEKLRTVRERTRRPFIIYSLVQGLRQDRDDVRLLAEQRAQLDGDRIEELLARRPTRSLRDSTTVMFTSGSTGRPKGVSFNQYNLVTKRFARTAALPEVGRDETLLCYLPLYHTFGRYLEMLGTIFWGGTYVFASNPSVDTLLDQFRRVRPTALISVPVRWVQIRERVLELAALPENADRDQSEIFRELVGDRLYWGLSAAGYLDPRVFRFYHRHGVQLCSGFGMTEGTGGLTMTPPDDYVENSVGLPLPGVVVQFAEQGELQIAGPYIARYLPEEAEPGDLSVDEPDSDTYWLSTGDLFRETERGHLEIVDRIKDIYKNNRGQTIAPRKVEALFDGVPGITRTFLAGDGRAFNTLLIVPDDKNEMLRSLNGEEERREYFQQIVTAANPKLAAYERVVNFAILKRDFTVEKGELTPKGSYRRKNIEANFSDSITELYRSNVIELEVPGIRLLIPRWFFRDLGVLENAVEVIDGKLYNRETGLSLTVEAMADGHVRIGNLEYHYFGQTLNLGLITRQPRLWMANPEVIAFCPCKLGWDVDLGGFSEQVFLPTREAGALPVTDDSDRVEPQLAEINSLCCRALYGDSEDALAAIRDLADQLTHVGVRRSGIIRRRLEALANHADQSVRCRAYQVLVLDQPTPDYLTYLPAFIEAGKPFLDAQSFQAISQASIEPRRLLAFRQRLHAYRTQLTWPAPERTRRLFTDLFHLLADFGRYHPEFYSAIREELVSWIIHDQDTELAEAAQKEFTELAAWFEARLKSGYLGLAPDAWTGKIVFQEGLSPHEVERLQQVLVGTTFLKESILLAFEGEELSLQEIGPGGIWVSRIISRYEDARYRVSVNTKAGKHFDLQLIISLEDDEELVQETILWYIVLRGYPFGTPMLPSFGCCRPELGALSMAYVSGLTVWEKIREFSSVRGPGTALPTRMRWHQLLVRAMSVVIKGWRNSGRRIIPGLITPNNIVVPEPDFRRGAIQNNLSGWKLYTGPLSLLRPLWRNIYQHTISHYPWCRDYLERHWIFEAFVEAVGVDESRRFFEELLAEASPRELDEMGLGFATALHEFLDKLSVRYYPPLRLQAAIARFDEWQHVNAQAPPRSRLDILEELKRLYRLDQLPEIARFSLFRNTYFRDADIQLLDIFDRLLVRMFRYPTRRPSQMVELSDLQSALGDPDDRVAFNRMAFPHRRRSERIEVQTVGDPERSQVVVRSTVTDRHGQTYVVGEPSNPAEVGSVYQLFLRSGYPKRISEADCFYVVQDQEEQLVGAIVYRWEAPDAVFLDGVVVAQTVRGRGVASAILEDFCTRVTARGARTIQTHFFLRRFYEKHGFRVDNRWGGLVRHL